MRETLSMFRSRWEKMEREGKIFKIDRGYQTKCWEANYRKISTGYVQINLNYKMYLLHRISYMLFVAKREIGQEIVVDHLCGNRACCNPEHLRGGTWKDNMRAAVRRRGIPKNSKLSEKDIKDMRSMYDRGKYKIVDIAKKYNYDPSNTRKIVLRQTYKNVK